MIGWLLALMLGCGAPAPAPSPKPAPAPKTAKAAKSKAAKTKTKAPMEKVGVKLFFVNDAKGELVAVEREVGSKTIYRNALFFLFKGPNEAETNKGLSVVKSGSAGFSDLKVDGDTISLKLRDGCEKGDGKFTIWDSVHATLTAFDDIKHVKLLDPEGNTTNADGPGDSKPACLGG